MREREREREGGGREGGRERREGGREEGGGGGSRGDIICGKESNNDIVLTHICRSQGRYI